MTHLLVIDYPHFTVRKLFPSLESVLEFNAVKKDLLNARAYPITDFTNEQRYNIDTTQRIDYTLIFKSK